MSGLLQGMRCAVNRSFLMARMSGPRNFLQNKCMHTAISSSGVFAPSLVQSVQVIQYFSQWELCVSGHWLPAIRLVITDQLLLLNADSTKSDVKLSNIIYICVNVQPANDFAEIR